MGDRVTIDPIAAARSSTAVCPHLGRPAPAADNETELSIPDWTNRCLALTDPIRLSPDQQRLVCATVRHRTCRRHLLAESGAAPTAFEPIRPLLLRPAIVASLAVLALAAAVAIGYLASGGSLVIPGVESV